MLLNLPSEEISFLELERARNPCHPKIKILKYNMTKVDSDVLKECHSPNVFFPVSKINRGSKIVLPHG